MRSPPLWISGTLLCKGACTGTSCSLVGKSLASADPTTSTPSYQPESYSGGLSSLALSPSASWQDSLVLPRTFNVKQAPEYNSLIHDIKTNLVPSPKAWSALKRYVWSTPSKAFSWSTDKNPKSWELIFSQFYHITRRNKIVHYCASRHAVGPTWIYQCVNMFFQSTVFNRHFGGIL